MCRIVCLPTWFTRLVNYIHTTERRQQHKKQQCDSSDSERHRRPRRTRMQRAASLRSPSSPSVVANAVRTSLFLPSPFPPLLCSVLFSPVLGLSVLCRPPPALLPPVARCTRFYALSLTPPKGGREEGGRKEEGGEKWEGHYQSRQFECILYCPFYAGSFVRSLSLSLVARPPSPLAREHE